MIRKTSLNAENKNLIDSIGYLILYIMVGFIPHIYKYMPFKVAESESIYFKEEMYADLYMLGKSRVFLGLTLLLLGVFVYQLAKKHFVFIKDKITIVTGLFAGIVLISSFMSGYQDLVYLGAKDRFEGMWVWLAYLVVFTVARHYGMHEGFVDRLLKVFVFSASIMAVFGLMQVFGYDIYTAGPLRWLCFPKEIASNMTDFMVTNMTEAGAVGAMFNSNYFGVYVGLSALVALGIAFLTEKRNGVFLALAVLLYGAMIASKSEAALLGFALALFLFMLGYGNRVWQKKLYLGIMVLAAVIMDRFLAMNLLYGQSGNALWIYLIMITGLIIGLTISRFVEVKTLELKILGKYSAVLSLVAIMLVAITINYGIGVVGSDESKIDISKIEYSQNILMLENSDGTSLSVEILKTGLNAYDQDMTLLQPEVTNENVLSYTVGNLRYTFVVNNYDNGVLLSFKTPISLHVFYDGTTMTYVNPASGFGQIEMPDRINYYYEHGSAFTNRAYIWSTYLPMASKHLVAGQGLDTYVPGFPQNDYFGKATFYASGDNMIIDKPHSIYIDVLFTMGIVGLMTLMGFAFAVGKEYFEFIALGEENQSNGALVLIGLVMLLVAGIFNDSTIPLTLLMSCFGGMGLRVHEEA